MPDETTPVPSEREQLYAAATERAGRLLIEDERELNRLSALVADLQEQITRARALLSEARDHWDAHLGDRVDTFLASTEPQL